MDTQPVPSPCSQQGHLHVTIPVRLAAGPADRIRCKAHAAELAECKAAGILVLYNMQQQDRFNTLLTIGA